MSTDGQHTVGSLQVLDDHGILHLILEWLKRPVPPIGMKHSQGWKAMHQGDLARCMPVCSVRLRFILTYGLRPEPVMHAERG